MLYAIGDLHLSLEADKPMEVFGSGWSDHINRIRYGFSGLTENDVTVICGDISWSMSLEKSIADFRFIEGLPGKKIILKGNHDYWWSTAAKMRKFFEENGLKTISILHNNCYFYEDVAVCGTRGWFFEEERGTEHDKKILARELLRLEASLKTAEGYDKKLCFLHYPPRYNSYICSEVIEILKKYGVSKCFYGHIHGKGHALAIQGVVDGIDYRMVSADYLGFTPVRIV